MLRLGLVSSALSLALGCDPSAAGGGGAPPAPPTAPATPLPPGSGPVDPAIPTAPTVPGFDLEASAWLPGLPTQRVPGPSIEPLPGEGSGRPLWVSNNPEIFTGDGWLAQNARVDPTRGGAFTPLAAVSAYLFHLNQSGSTKTVHLLASNPNPGSVTVDARGSLYRNQDFPISPTGGPSYEVAADALAGTYDVARTVDIGSLQVVELDRIAVGNGGVLDGRFEIDATGPVLLYTVVTSSGSTTAAINASQGAPAPGGIAQPGPNAYGRSAGVYAYDTWTSWFDVAVPAAGHHLALALNTSGKFALDGAAQQEQSPAAIQALGDSSPRHYGSYGVRYAVDFELCAPTATRTVRLSFASNLEGPGSSPSFTWNGPVRVNGTTTPVSLTLGSSVQTLRTWTIPAGTCQAVELDTVVPGLITIGQHLLLESI